MDDVAGLAGLVALDVAGVLEDHPAVAGLGERAHHAGVEVAGLHLPLVDSLGFGLDVGALEGFAVEVGEVRDVLGIEERPHTVFVGRAA